jgi:hypothetical protein
MVGLLLAYDTYIQPAISPDRQTDIGTARDRGPSVYGHTYVNPVQANLLPIRAGLRTNHGYKSTVG